MQKSTFIIVLLGFIFLIPLNIYYIGDGFGGGIQWTLFKYQFTPFGSSWFSIFMDLDYVINGIITGRSALSLVLWSAGSFLLLIIIISFVLVIMERKQEMKRLFGIMTILVGFFYLISCMFQYGPTLSGPAGYCIPVGIPVIWAFGSMIYSDFFKISDKEKIEENEEILREKEN